MTTEQNVGALLITDGEDLALIEHLLHLGKHSYFFFSDKAVRCDDILRRVREARAGSSSERIDHLTACEKLLRSIVLHAKHTLRRDDGGRLIFVETGWWLDVTEQEEALFAELLEEKAKL